MTEPTMPRMHVLNGTATTSSKVAGSQLPEENSDIIDVLVADIDAKAHVTIKEQPATDQA